jgi:spermidine/putrescine transport system ATP-binding protein/putrescine transport system ATP-binding protein
MKAATPIIAIREVSKSFGSVRAVDSVDLDIYPNEFFALLGPSGCGKTTLLRMLAGFETPDSGRLEIDGEDMTDRAPNRRPVNMVFQSYAVFPHMSVHDNVAYGLKVVGTKSAEIAPRVREALEMVQLGEMGARRPDQLSGGQRQRVALARALVKRPRVLLLDEPLSALDAKLRETMQLELVRLQHSVGITFVIVTHDQNEALSMADRIAVMEGGKVRQVAPPAELYENPANRFVADFIGKVNLFEGRFGEAREGALLIEVAGLGALPVAPGEEARRIGETAARSGAPVSLAVRPEKIRLFDERPADRAIALPGTLREIAYYGDASHVFVTLEGGLVISANLMNDSRQRREGRAEGTPVWCSWEPEDGLLLPE